MNHKKLRACEWLKTRAFSCKTSANDKWHAHAFKICSVLTFCDVFFTYTIKSNNMIFLTISCNEHEMSLKHSLVLINTKLHSKS